jgi:phosphatidylglycerol:prolipoprotein diacylglycerol transferase
VALSIGQAVGRLGCQLSGDGDYGVPTTMPWGMSYPNGVVPTTDVVHPTPIHG